MLLAQTYANNISIDLDGSEKPNLPTQYFPTPEKYITIQNSSGMPAKDYNLWQEVIDLIHPYFKKENIEIVQIGQGEIQPLNKTINFVNKTNFAQSVYVLNHSLLHAGNDSWAAHASTSPVVILYGSTSISAHSPFYSNSRSKFIESHRFGNRPSFQATENPKTVNLIKPEKIAKSILEILNIENNITEQTFYIGDIYLQGHSIDVIPDAIVNPKSIAPGVLNLRADLFFDSNGIISNLQQRAYALWIDREIDLNILKQLKPNIPAIVYEVDETTNPKYLEKVIRLGIQIHLWTRMPPETHDKIKLDFLDLPLITRRDDIKIEQIEEKIKKYLNIDFTPNLNQINYFSKKHYLSNGKIYQSLYDWRKQKSVDNIESNSIGDLSNQDFRNEIDQFLIYSN